MQTKEKSASIKMKRGKYEY